MFWFILLVLIAVVVLLSIFGGNKKEEARTVSTKVNSKKLPYKKKKYLCTIPERKFYEKILGVLPAGYIVLPQVNLSAIIQVDRSKVKYRERRKFRSKIDKKSIDFVIFTKKYLCPILCIEYDDASHEKDKRKKRDKFVDTALGATDIKIVHVRYHSSHEEKVLKALEKLDVYVEQWR